VDEAGVFMPDARLLLARHHEVVIVERDPAMIEQVRDELDVGFIQCEGTRPAILSEPDPEATEVPTLESMQAMTSSR
jgi:Trk K+ transport system NAD-binding subunit